MVADPSIAAAIEDIAARWTASAPVVSGACPTVSVRSMASATMAAQLVNTDTSLPQVWIPDSTAWVDRVRHDTAGRDSPVSSLWLYPPIARSPLVLATTATGLEATRATAARGWASVLSGPAPPVTLEPRRNTEGLATLLTAQTLVNGAGTTPRRQLIDALVRLSRQTVPDSAAGLGLVRQHPSTARAVVISERAALELNAKRNVADQVGLIYPRGAAVGLDWPVVQFSPPGGEPALRDATTTFVAQLSTPESLKRLQSTGLRNPTPATAAGVPAAQFLRRPTTDQQTAALRAWTAAGRTSRTLMVIDLSGSMSESIGGGQTKIQFAAAAGRSAISFFPDTSSIGLWGFSVDRSPKSDWTQLVSLGPLSGSIGRVTRRQALVTAATAMPSITHGDTGLYATTLAAYEKVRSGFNPESVNSVVLLTDGANTDTRGISLPSLLKRLGSEHDSRRPVPIITIAVGRGADTATLKRISAATGGRCYVVSKPDDIHDALLDAVIQAR
ncbi:MAG: VWA domain-containing protein [Actinomycetota bacterium]